jgi:hypothetical protein
MRLSRCLIQTITTEFPGSQRRQALCIVPASSVLIPAQYHADNGGSFEIVSQQGDGEGGALMQMSPLYPSKTDWVADYDPITSLGDANWTVPLLDVFVDLAPANDRCAHAKKLLKGYAFFWFARDFTRSIV